MPSIHISRRAALRSAAGLIGGLAGCGFPEDEPSPSASGPPTGAVTDPPHVQVRNPDAAPVVFEGEQTPTETDADEHFWRHHLVTDSETAADLTFAAVEGVDRIRSLLDDTDFDSETVYVEQRAIAECFERKLCWVRWSRVEVETDYVRRYRDADVACDADGRDVLAVCIRLPTALDAGDVHQYGSSSGSGRCRPPEERSGERA